MTKFSAIVLAAGLSSRMEGGHKLLMSIDEKTVFEHSLKSITAADFLEVIVVLGKEAERLEKLIPKEYMVQTVVNSTFELGMTPSIQTGIAEATGDVYVICLADMPFLTAADYNQLMDCFREENGKNILVPLYEGVKGNPVLFDKDYRKEILEHTQPNGCSQIVKQNSKKTHFFETNNLRFTLDIDTKADFDKWTNAK